MRRIILLFLMLAAVGFGADVTCVRTGAGYLGDQSYASNAARAKTILRPQKTQTYAYDGESIKVLAVQGNKVFVNRPDVDDSVLYYTTFDMFKGDIPQFEILYDLADLGDFSEGDTPEWMECYGSNWILGTGEPTGRIYRSTDQGASWTKVLTMTGNGYMTEWGTGGGATDGHVLVFEYGGSLADDNGAKRLYESEDYGATWTLIHTQEDAYTRIAISSVTLGGSGVDVILNLASEHEVASGDNMQGNSWVSGITGDDDWDTNVNNQIITLSYVDADSLSIDGTDSDDYDAGSGGYVYPKQHIHNATYGADTDTLYFSVGDEIFVSGIYKMTKSGGTWGSLTRLNISQPTVMFWDSVDSRLVTLSDGTKEGTSNEISLEGYPNYINRYDSSGNHYAGFWYPRYNSSIYMSQLESTFNFGHEEYRGVHYIGLSTMSVTATANEVGGLVVTKDFENYYYSHRFFNGSNAVWQGVHLIEGPDSSGYMWGCYSDGSNPNDFHLFCFKTVEFQDATVYRVGTELDNLAVKTAAGDGQYSADDSEFESTDGLWTSSNATISIDSTEMYAGSGCLKIVPTAVNGYAWSGKFGATEYGLESILSDSDYVVSSFYCKATSDWPDNMYVTMEIYDADGEFVDPSTVFKPTTEWKRYWNLSKLTSAAGLANNRVRVTAKKAYGDDPGTIADATFYIDNFQIIADGDQYPIFQEWYPAGNGSAAVDRPQEYLAVDTSGDFTDDNWAVSFTWYAGLSYRHVGASAKIYIASLENSGEYADLYYDGSDNKFYLNDGSNTIATAAYSIKFYDIVQFAIQSNGLTTALYVYPSYGIPGNSEYLTPATSTNLVFSNPPDDFYLGTNNDQSGEGWGEYSDIQIYTALLNAEELDELYGYEIPSTGSGSSGGVYNGGLYGN